MCRLSHLRSNLPDLLYSHPGFSGCFGYIVRPFSLLAVEASGSRFRLQHFSVSTVIDSVSYVTAHHHFLCAMTRPTSVSLVRLRISVFHFVAQRYTQRGAFHISLLNKGPSFRTVDHYRLNACFALKFTNTLMAIKSIIQLPPSPFSGRLWSMLWICIKDYIFVGFLHTHPAAIQIPVWPRLPSNRKGSNFWRVLARVAYL